MAMAMLVDWSELPKDLLNLISQRIDNEIDLIRFRSTCSNWRSSSIPNHYRNTLTFQFPLLQSSLNIDTIAKFQNLTKYSFFLIKPPKLKGQQTHPFLIKISQNSNGKIQLFPPPRSSPLVLDFTEFSVLHLATNFMFRRYKPFQLPSSWRPVGRGHFSPKMVIAVTCHGKKPILLGICSCFKKLEQPVVFKCGDENWKAIPHMSAYLGDICVFKGRPYAVDKTGRTVTVGLGPDNDSTVELVAESLVGGGDIKFLVESKGDLLLADVNYNREFDDDIKVVKIDVFKLNEREKKWVKLANIGDRVLFLGPNWSFSASALDLCVPKGNCVIIMDDFFTCDPTMGYFLDLDDGRPCLCSIILNILNCWGHLQS